MTNFALPFIKAVKKKKMSKRFPGHDIFTILAGAVFVPCKIPSNPSERYSRSRDSIATLATHYDCDTDKTISEWKEAVTVAKEGYTKAREFLKFLVYHCSLYPNLGKIGSALLVVPVHSC